MLNSKNSRNLSIKHLPGAHNQKLHAGSSESFENKENCELANQLLGVAHAPWTVKADNPALLRPEFKTWAKDVAGLTRILALGEYCRLERYAGRDRYTDYTYDKLQRVFDEQLSSGIARSLSHAGEIKYPVSYVHAVYRTGSDLSYEELYKEKLLPDTHPEHIRLERIDERLRTEERIADRAETGVRTDKYPVPDPIVYHAAEQAGITVIDSWKALAELSNRQHNCVAIEENGWTKAIENKNVVILDAGDSTVAVSQLRTDEDYQRYMLYAPDAAPANVGDWVLAQAAGVNNIDDQNPKQTEDFVTLLNELAYAQTRALQDKDLSKRNVDEYGFTYKHLPGAHDQQHHAGENKYSLVAEAKLGTPEREAQSWRFKKFLKEHRDVIAFFTRGDNTRRERESLLRVIGGDSTGKQGELLIRAKSKIQKLQSLLGMASANTKIVYMTDGSQISHVVCTYSDTSSDLGEVSLAVDHHGAIINTRLYAAERLRIPKRLRDSLASEDPQVTALKYVAYLADGVGCEADVRNISNVDRAKAFAAGFGIVLRPDRLATAIGTFLADLSNQAKTGAERTILLNASKSYFGDMSLEVDKQLGYHQPLSEFDYYNRTIVDNGDIIAGAEFPIGWVVDTYEDKAGFDFASTYTYRPPHGVAKHLAGQHNQQYHAGNKNRLDKDRSKLIAILQRYALSTGSSLDSSLENYRRDADGTRVKSTLRKIDEANKLFKDILGSTGLESEAKVYATGLGGDRDILMMANAKLHLYIADNAENRLSISVPIEGQAEALDKAMRVAEDNQAMLTANVRVSDAVDRGMRFTVSPLLIGTLTRGYVTFLTQLLDNRASELGATRKETADTRQKISTDQNKLSDSIARQLKLKFADSLLDLDDLANVSFEDDVFVAGTSVPLTLALAYDSDGNNFMNAYLNAKRNFAVVSKHLPGRHAQTTHAGARGLALYQQQDDKIEFIAKQLDNRAVGIRLENAGDIFRESALNEDSLAHGGSRSYILEKIAGIYKELQYPYEFDLPLSAKDKDLTSKAAELYSAIDGGSLSPAQLVARDLAVAVAKRDKTEIRRLLDVVMLELKHLPGVHEQRDHATKTMRKNIEMAADPRNFKFNQTDERGVFDREDKLPTVVYADQISGVALARKLKPALKLHGIQLDCRLDNAPYASFRASSGGLQTDWVEFDDEQTISIATGLAEVLDPFGVDVEIDAESVSYGYAGRLAVNLYFSGPALTSDTKLEMPERTYTVTPFTVEDLRTWQDYAAGSADLLSSNILTAGDAVNKDDARVLRTNDGMPQAVLSIQFPDSRTVGKGRTLKVNDIAVAPWNASWATKRDKGWGKAAVVEAAKIAISSGYAGIHLLAAGDAASYYTKLGLQQTGLNSFSIAGDALQDLLRVSKHMPGQHEQRRHAGSVSALDGVLKKLSDPDNVLEITKLRRALNSDKKAQMVEAALVDAFDCFSELVPESPDVPRLRVFVSEGKIFSIELTKHAITVRKEWVSASNTELTTVRGDSTVSAHIDAILRVAESRQGVARIVTTLDKAAEHGLNLDVRKYVENVKWGCKNILDDMAPDLVKADAAALLRAVADNESELENSVQSQLEPYVDHGMPIPTLSNLKLDLGCVLPDLALPFVSALDKAANLLGKLNYIRTFDLPGKHNQQHRADGDDVAQTATADNIKNIVMHMCNSDNSLSSQNRNDILDTLDNVPEEKQVLADCVNLMNRTLRYLDTKFGPGFVYIDDDENLPNRVVSLVFQKPYKYADVTISTLSLRAGNETDLEFYVKLNKPDESAQESKLDIVNKLDQYAAANGGAVAVGGFKSGKELDYLLDKGYKFDVSGAVYDITTNFINFLHETLRKPSLRAPERLKVKFDTLDEGEVSDSFIAQLGKTLDVPVDFLKYKNISSADKRELFSRRYALLSADDYANAQLVDDVITGATFPLAMSISLDDVRLTKVYPKPVAKHLAGRHNQKHHSRYSRAPRRVAALIRAEKLVSDTKFYIFGKYVKPAAADIHEELDRLDEQELENFGDGLEKVNRIEAKFLDTSGLGTRKLSYVAYASPGEVTVHREIGFTSSHIDISHSLDTNTTKITYNGSRTHKATRKYNEADFDVITRIAEEEGCEVRTSFLIDEDAINGLLSRDFGLAVDGRVIEAICDGYIESVRHILDSGVQTADVRRSLKELDDPNKYVELMVDVNAAFKDTVAPLRADDLVNLYVNDEHILPGTKVPAVLALQNARSYLTFIKDYKKLS